MDNGRWFIVLLGLVLGAALYDIYIALHRLTVFLFDVYFKVISG